jgi:hypothetical protein
VYLNILARALTIRPQSRGASCATGNTCENRVVFVNVRTLRICKRYPHISCLVAVWHDILQAICDFLQLVLPCCRRLSLAPHVSSLWPRTCAQLLLTYLPTAAAAGEWLAHPNNKHLCHDVSKYRGSHVPTHALFSNGGRVSCDEALLREREVNTGESRCSWTLW